MNLGRAFEVGGRASQRPSGNARRLLPARVAYCLVTLLAAWLVLEPTVAAHADAGERIALVMAVENYQKLPKSSLGLKRAEDIAAALKARGFNVLMSANPSNSAARASLGAFAAKAQDADVALVMLIGHGTAWAGQSFFLLSNTEISRATDLFSRALSVTNIAQIAGRARIGGVFFFMTTPNFGTPIEGLNDRPQFNGTIGKNVVAVFSSSARVPVSRVDAVSAEAADALVKFLRGPDPTLAGLVKAASKGGKETIVGTAGDVDLAKPPAVAKPEASTAGGASTPGKQAKADDARPEAGEQPRKGAGEQARAEQIRTEQARAEVEKARAEAKKAEAEAARVQAEARKAQAEAERAKAEAEQAKLEARQNEAEARAAAAGAAPIREWQLAREQRLQIQERLSKLGFYKGPIDAIIGPLTRQAIMGFQRSSGATVTGYLTSAQFDALTKAQ